MPDEKVRNVIRDTRKNVKYIILADKKLNRNEMLKQIKIFMYNPINIRQKRDSVVELDYVDE